MSGGTMDTPDATGSVAGSEIYRVRLDGFEGPLDLLLHLVRVNEVDVTDIPIVEITRQYNDFLDVMRDLNLEIAGEYLVMAATLMHIKSRMLLPPDPASPEETGEDPRTDLAKQLLEYQRYKQAAENLHALDSAQALVFTQDGRIPAEFSGEEILAVDLFDLIAAFRGVLGRLDDEVRLHLRRDDVSVADKISWLIDQLEERSSLDLMDLLSALPTRLERIATFLAVLELVRLRIILAFQRMRLGAIRIALRDEPDGRIAGDSGAESPVTEERVPGADGGQPEGWS